MKRYTGQSLSRLSKHHKIKSYKDGGVVEDDTPDEGSGVSIKVGGESTPKGVAGPGNIQRTSGVAGGAHVSVPVGDYSIGVGADYSKIKLQGPGGRTAKRGGVSEVSVSRDLGDDSEVSLKYGRSKDEGKASHSLSIGYSRKF